jgi:hypothetical protein
MKAPKHPALALLSVLLPLCGLAGCEPQQSHSAAIMQTGILANPALDEASGMQGSRRLDGVYFLHNDDGEARIFAIGPDGSDLGSFVVEQAENRDWEDLAAVPSDSGPLLLIADTGDNFAQHERTRLYFVIEPEPDESGRYSGQYPLHHAIDLQYPDGPRDCESVAWDPHSDRIFLLSKRDKPAHIYSIARQDALAQTEAILTRHGTAFPFRPPGPRDMMFFGHRDGPWVAQPTGLDFSPDGSLAAVISYRSLYLFSRSDPEDWTAALQRKPIEFEGPPSRKEEAVAFSRDGRYIMITTEGVPAPIYRFRQLEKDG